MIGPEARETAAEFLVDSIEYLRAGGVTSEIMSTLNSVDLSHEDGSDFIDYFLLDLMGTASSYIKTQFPPNEDSHRLDLLLSAASSLTKDISGLSITDLELMINTYQKKATTPPEFDRVSVSLMIHTLLAPVGRRRLLEERARFAEAYIRVQPGLSGSVE